MSVLLTLSLLLQTTPEWWNAEWRCRRQVSITNNLGKTLETGHSVALELDLEYLKLNRKALQSLADFRLLHRNRPIPFMLRPGGAPGQRRLWFRTAVALPPGTSDDAYCLYYGNPSAPETSAEPAAVFDLFEDFSNPGGFRDTFEAGGGPALAVEKGALRIRPEASTNLHPARLNFLNPPPTDGFFLEFDLELETPKEVPLEFSIQIDLEEPGAETPEALTRRIDRLVAELGSDDGEIREQASEELIRIGKPALNKVEAATHSTDAEVKWRAIVILRRIREAAPPPTIRAGVLLGDRRIGPVALVHAIGRSTGSVGRNLTPPLKFHIQVARDPEGNVLLTWNQRHLQRGSLPGRIRSISFICQSPFPSPKTLARIDNVLLRRHVDDEKRPTYSIQIEETKP